MLALKLGLSVSSSNYQTSGAWSPTDESSLEAWYQKGVGITLNGSDVSAWADSSSNNIDMEQSSLPKQPAYADGVLSFNSAASDFLQSSGQIELTGDFTIGAKLKLTTLGSLLGDNTTSGEFVRFSSNSNVKIKINNASLDIPKDSGNYAEEAYVVFTRVSNTITMYWKGVAQTTTGTLSGTADIDCIGVRETNRNAYNGDLSEIQIYSSSSAALTANVTARLASLMP